MPETDSVIAELLGILNQDMGLTVGAPDTDLFESGILDSLALVNLLLHLESRFKVTVTLENLELDNFRSVVAMARFIAAYRGNGASARGRSRANYRKATGSALLE